MRRDLKGIAFMKSIFMLSCIIFLSYILYCAVFEKLTRRDKIVLSLCALAMINGVLAVVFNY